MRSLGMDSAGASGSSSPHRSVRHLFVLGVCLLLAFALVGCGRGPKASVTRKPTPVSTASTSVPTTTTSSTTTSTSTTTTTLPSPAPAPVTPLVEPALPGEGQWQSAGDRLAGGWAMYTTQLRPASGLPPSGIACINTAATTTVLYAGTAEPQGVWSHQGEVAPAQQTTLLGAFNSGFKIYAYVTGWYADGHAAMALQAGKASLVTFADGTATVGNWGRDVTPGPSVVAVRQNLDLLVDGGVSAPTVTSPGLWGAVLGGGILTWRSGVGVTAAGDLIYVGGPSLDPAALARLLVAAGAVRAMELDINHEWVSFATFTHPGGAGSGAPVGTNLLPDMYFAPNHYLAPFSRDFFAVFAR